MLFTPSQSAWCNAVVLVRKKDGGLCFCIDFQCLNACMKKNSYPLSRIQEALAIMEGVGHFSCLDLKSGFIHYWQPRPLQMWLHAFWTVQCPSHIQQLMQICLGELNLIYCLVYLDDIVVFLHTVEEHLHWLHITFDQFREHNLKLKLSKCKFFKEEITFLAHQVSKEGVQPGNLNLKAITECVPPQTYTEVCAFLGVVGHYRIFIKGFSCIAQPLNEHLAGEGASRKLEWVSLSEDALKAFEALKQVCMTTPVLAFADYTKLFLLETNASKDRLRAVLLQKQADGWYYPVTYGSRALMPHEKNYHSTKLEFLALKWAVTENFKEYLSYETILVKTDNNPLTYIMMTPNLAATSHQWVSALVQFNFELEYQKGCDNTVADVLSWVTTQLDPDTVRSILNGVAMGSVHWAEIHDPTVVEGDHHLEQEVHVTTDCVLVQMHVTDWTEAKREDLMLSTDLDWLKAQKKTDLKALLAEHASSKEGQQNQQNFMTHQGALYLHSTPKGKTKDLLLFVVHETHCVAAFNVCHRDAGHKGHDHTLSLLWECFWWPGMANQIQRSIKSCMCCLQHEGNLSKAPLHLIVTTTPMDLLHGNFTRIEMTLELNRLPKVINVLVFQGHFTKHILAYVTPNQAAKTVVNSCIRVTSQSFEPQPGSWVIGMLTSWAALLMRCVGSLAWKKLQTILYHPQMNGFVGRSHQTIMQMIRKLGEDKKANWPGHLAEIVHAYNAT